MRQCVQDEKQVSQKFTDMPRIQHEFKQKYSKDMQILTDMNFLGEMEIQLLQKDMYIDNIAFLIFKLTICSKDN